MEIVPITKILIIRMVVISQSHGREYIHEPLLSIVHLLF